MSVLEMGIVVEDPIPELAPVPPTAPVTFARWPRRPPVIFAARHGPPM
jgi:hypothetical protein